MPWGVVIYSLSLRVAGANYIVVDTAIINHFALVCKIDFWEPAAAADVCAFSMHLEMVCL